MHFGLSEDQQQLRDIARRFLARAPSARQRLEREEGPLVDRATWTRMVEEHGWPAMSLPEEAGGWGFGLLELAVVLEELGRTLTPCPLLSVALAGQALAACRGTEAFLERIASGARAVVAWPQAGWDGPAEPLGLHDAPEGQLQLSGTVSGVRGADTAELVCVELFEGLLVLERDTPGLRVEAGHSLDPTRPLGTVHLEAIAVDTATLFTDHHPVAFRTRARALLAAEQTGVAQGALDLTVAYAKVRTQFGRPIGAFQAVQHQLADVLVATECARSATWYAAAALDAALPEAEEAALTALCTASEAATLASGQAIQLHGGIGFTWEHDAHLFFKRAAANRHLLGAPDTLRAAVADRILGPMPAGGAG